MKRLILLSIRGAFTEWGPGCLLATMNLIGETENAVAVGVRTGGEWVVLSRHADQETADRQCHEWLSWIVSAVDGGLLRWDNERGCVVDELAEDEEVFADPFTSDEPVHCPVCGAEMVMDYDGGELVCSSDECDARQPIADVPEPEYQRCPECDGFLLALPSETEGGCENPFCSLAVRRTEAESMASRRVPVQEGL